jgi:hypothetical protein
MTQRQFAACGEDGSPDGSRRSASGSSRPALLLVAMLAIAGWLATPAHALPPEELAATEPATTSDPYVYPPVLADETTVPPGWLRAPAAVFDLLVVRPVMAVGLVGGAGLSLVVLPIQAPAAVTDETLETLADQAKSTFTRPLGSF